MPSGEKIKPVALAVIELHLSKGISESVSWLVADRQVGRWPASQPVSQQKNLLNISLIL